MMGGDLVRLASPSLSGLSCATLSVDPPSPLRDPKMGPLAPSFVTRFRLSSGGGAGLTPRPHPRVPATGFGKLLVFRWNAAFPSGLSAGDDAEEWLVWLSSDA